MVETSLKGLVRINQMQKCASKGKLYCKNKYTYGESFIWKTSLMATVQVFDKGILRNARGEVDREQITKEFILDAIVSF